MLVLYLASRSGLLVAVASIAGNLESVRARVRSAAETCGRDPGDVRIVAVSKTFGERQVREAFAAGQQDFGENYAPEFRQKADATGQLDIRWHFIGRLQSNKAKVVVGRTFLVHSL